MRRILRGWLLAPGGGVLVVPGEPGLEWHDAMCTGVSDWETLFANGSAELTFTCYDPNAYGEGKGSTAAVFTVGGSCPTWPTVELVAVAGSAVQVADSTSGAFVRIERDFAAGDAVVIDCEGQRVMVGGEDATADVTLGSDFIALTPGDVALTFSGCSAHTVSWVERWA